MKISKQSWLIAAIGIADLVTTIIFIEHHGAQEANPLFRFYWEKGLLTFIVAKFACLFGPILVLEWARKRNPRFVSRALQMAIVAYLVMYGIGFAKLNSPLAHAEEIHAEEFRPMEVAMASDTLDHRYALPTNPYVVSYLGFASARNHMPQIPLWHPMGGQSFWPMRRGWDMRFSLFPMVPTVSGHPLFPGPWGKAPLDTDDRR